LYKYDTDGQLVAGNVVSEVIEPGTPHGDPVTTFPNLVTEIHYPDPETGQPSPDNAVKLAYTANGRIARRTDQRGVTLDYEYGTCTSGPPGEELTAVVVSEVGEGITNEEVDESIRRLEFARNANGWVTRASTHPNTAPGATSSAVNFTHDSFGNLTSERLQPFTFTQQKTINYDWQWVGDNKYRLNGMTYPSGREFEFLYGGPTDYASYDINRITGIETATGTEIIRYEKTGAGRIIKKIWGADRVTLAYGPEGTGPSGLDRFGRPVRMSFSSMYDGVQLEYKYDYDKNGNRTAARIKQVGHPNDRSYLYGYDELNRLKYAERGVLDPDSTGVSYGGTGLYWTLDNLGNWSGGSGNDSLVEYVAEGLPGFQGFEDWTEGQHHVTDSQNRIVSHIVHPQGGDPDEAGFYYDKTGNLLLNRDHFHVYDAWDRPVWIKLKGTLEIAGDGESLIGSPGAAVARYYYDALGRRVRKKVTSMADPPTLATVEAGDYFYYDGNRLIEHHKSTEVQVEVPCDGGPLPGKAIQRSGEVALDDVYAQGKPQAADQGNRIGQDHPEGGAGIGDQSGEVAKDQPQSKPGELPYVPCYETQVEVQLDREYVYGLDYIDEIVAEFYGTNNKRYYHQDANYNVIAVTDYSGGVYQQYSYDPYGQLLDAEDGNGISIDFESDPTLVHSHFLGAGGKWFDHETGLYQNGVRYYDPLTARFTTADPNATGLVVAPGLYAFGSRFDVAPFLSARSQYTDTKNLYEYVGCDPVTGLDPTGRWTYTGVLTATASAAWLVYNIADTALGVRDFAVAFTDFLNARERTLSDCLSLGMTGIFLFGDSLMGPVDEIAGLARATRAIRSAKGAGKSLGKMTRHELTELIREAGTEKGAKALATSQEGLPHFLRLLTKQISMRYGVTRTLRKGYVHMYATILVAGE